MPALTTSRRLRPCLHCGTPTTATICPRCGTVEANPYATAEYQTNRALCLTEETTCWLCHQPGTPTDPLTADHILPVAEGGDSRRSNLRAAHKSCNSRRGANGGGGHRTIATRQPPSVSARTSEATDTAFAQGATA